MECIQWHCQGTSGCHSVVVCTTQHQCVQNGKKVRYNRAEQGPTEVQFENDTCCILVLSKEIEQWPYYTRQHSVLERLNCYPILLGEKKAQPRWSHFRLLQSPLFISPGALAYLLSPRWLIGLETEIFFHAIKCSSLFHPPFWHT